MSPRQDQGFTASQVADWVGGTLVGPDHELTGVAPLSSAGPEQLAYVERAALPKDSGVRVVLAREPLSGVSTV